MAIRKIVRFGDSVLEKECRKVEKFDKKLHQLLDDMKENVGRRRRRWPCRPPVGHPGAAVCVVDVGRGPHRAGNPEIIATEGEQNGAEGCLSYPGEYGLVKRPMKVTVRAQDRNGSWFEKTGEALCARAFCHEIDHLHGILFTSHVSRMLTPGGAGIRLLQR